MSIFPWIFLGLVAGYVVGRAVNEPGEAVFLDVALVIAGAIYGGFVFTWMVAAGLTEFNLYKMFVEVVSVFASLVVCQVRFGPRLSARDRGDRSEVAATRRASTAGVQAES